MMLIKKSQSYFCVKVIFPLNKSQLNLKIKMKSINAQMLILQSIHKKGAQSAPFLWIGITQTNQELKFLAKSSSPLQWTKEYFRLTRFNGFELLART
jgi:hypothetical protein